MAVRNKAIVELERDSKLDRIIMTFIMLCIVAVGVYFAIYFNQVQRTSNVTIEAKKIETFEELKALNNTLLNDNYFITKDIIIDEDFTLGSKENPLTGKLFGNGHTISINCETSSSLIYQIVGNSTVSNLKVEYTKKTSQLTKDFGGIATINYGKITDCYVTYNEGLYVGDSATVGGVCALNFGELKNVICKVNLIENLTQFSNSRIGGIVGVSMDNSLIENCLSLATSQYVENIESNIENGQLKTYNIGKVYGTKFSNASVKSVYTVKTKALYSDKFDSGIVWNLTDEYQGSSFYYEIMKLGKTTWNIASLDSIELIITNINE